MLGFQSGGIFICPGEFTIAVEGSLPRSSVIDSLGFTDFHTESEALSIILHQFLTVQKIRLTYRSQDKRYDLQAVCQIFREFLATKLRDLTLDFNCERIELRVDSFASLSVLRHLKVEFHMLKMEGSRHVSPSMDLIP